MQLLDQYEFIHTEMLQWAQATSIQALYGLAFLRITPTQSGQVKHFRDRLLGYNISSKTFTLHTEVSRHAFTK